jgi:hypothetical protein
MRLYKHIFMTKGFAAWGPFVASFVVFAILIIGLAMWGYPIIKVSPLTILILLSWACVTNVAAAYFGIIRHLPPIDSPWKRWCAFLMYCFPLTISEPFYNHLCEIQEMMRLEGRSTLAIVWETVRQLISLFAKEGMYRVLDGLISIKKPTID